MSDSPDIKPPELPPLAKLEDLEAATVNMVITLADDSEVTWPMKMLPMYQMMQITAPYPDPKPPIADLKYGGAPVYDRTDPTYLAGCEQAAWMRNSLLIAEMSLIELPGDTREAKAEHIRNKFDPLVSEQIVLALHLQREKAKARIVSRAATFPRGRI